MTKRTEYLLFGVIMIFTVFIRFYQLGYSHYYGDEIKTLYLRKDVSAKDFLMDQRKGPGQFLISWAAEKVSGGYSELWIRFPYALIGTLLVSAVYYFTRQNFGVTVALFSSAMFSANGFYIAFSRTAQYQVAYLLLGFLCLIAAKKYQESRKLIYFIISALFLASALLCHYDALFFIIPLFYLVGLRTTVKIVLGGVGLSAVFYLPNIYLGYFKSNTLGYLSRRLGGSDYITNNSLYTLNVYNPFYIYTVLLITTAVSALRGQKNKYFLMLISWTVIPFLIFQLLILNPGTHIHNYLIPVIILGGVGLKFLHEKLGSFSPLVTITVTLALLFIVLIQTWVFLPGINNGYPWKKAVFHKYTTERVDNSYHLFLYGFPYNRGWSKISNFIKSEQGVRNFYTNDNENTAEYYLYGLTYQAPGTNFLPQYYIAVDHPQELKAKPIPPLSEYQEIWVDNEYGTTVFKKTSNVQ